MDKMAEQHGNGTSVRLMEASESDATSSWVVEIEKMLEDANPSVEMARWNRHSIYRVPHCIKDETNSEAYSPNFVSLGPLHHGEPHLQPMEEHKRRVVAHMVKRSGKPLQDFVAAIDEVADELQAAYNDLDDDKWRGENKGRFVEMMVMDGCFVLEWARTVGIGIEGENVAFDYATNDPVFSVRSYERLWPYIRRDMIAMENQLPLFTLHRLLSVQHSKFPEPREINRMVLRLLDYVPCYGKSILDKPGLHFLDIFHKNYCGTTQPWERSDKYGPPMPCAVDLSEAGIQFRKSNTENIHDVDFENGVLSMPLFQVNDDTEAELLNLMSFEWLHPDANLYVRWQICFVNQMVVSERDVALLRSEGLFANMIGSDKEGG